MKMNILFGGILIIMSVVIFISAIAIGQVADAGVIYKIGSIFFIAGLILLFINVGSTVKSDKGELK